MMPSAFTALGPTASVAAAAIAVVFTAAAVAKIRRPATAELRRLGLPAPRLLAAALPGVELAVVALILVQPQLGSAAAVALLAAFTHVLARAVAEGQNLSCGCFGSTDNRPVTWATVARNGVLLALAIVGLTGSGWTAPDPAAVAVVAGIALIGTVAVQMFDLWLSMGRLWSVRLAGEVGSTTSQVSLEVSAPTRRNAS